MSIKGLLSNKTSSRNLHIRPGVVAIKRGMTSIWNAQTSSYVPATLLSIENFIFDKKTEAKHGYNSVVMAYGLPTKITKPMAGILKLIEKTKDESRQDVASQHSHKTHEWKDLQHKKIAFSKLKEFRSELLEDYNIGDKVDASYFKEGQLVDVAGITLGKGFAGGMKRHNFRGLEASHGVSVSHRSSGSTGQRQDPGRTFKGKKMPGHMGSKRRTIMNLKVLGHYEKDSSIILVKGSVPGYVGSFVEIKDAVKV